MARVTYSGATTFTAPVPLGGFSIAQNAIFECPAEKIQYLNSLAAHNAANSVAHPVAADFAIVAELESEDTQDV